ncbi:uncharacterized protein LOC114337818 [Diabrotica virgifera virgifera]|uniref:Uncharacterized protein LOC114337818 n=1 Tax=Diabrotica virgifera virgifera TaxID=50390 RepID=A0A6P7G533_DIAVI|nr:uncharacterized protein LOC114337818 [Diabrotica virgifera virgifera]
MSRLLVYFLLVSTLCILQGHAQFNCYTCIGGATTGCALVLSNDEVERCSTQCTESYIEYQNGALKLVERRCWTPPQNTKYTNYCDWLRNSNITKTANAKIVNCRICKSDRCNGTKNLAPKPRTCVYGAL